MPEPTRCQGCGEEYPSRNAVFRHLTDTNGRCLEEKDYADFCRYVLAQKRQKVIILYGYLPGPKMESGDAAAELLLDALGEVQPMETEPDRRINRSYGATSRSTTVVEQDAMTGAVTEILTARLPPLVMEEGEWIDMLHEVLSKRLADSSAELRVLGRQVLPGSASTFNAEMDVAHRRTEYLLPADFLFDGRGPLREFHTRFPSFLDGAYGKAEHGSADNPVSLLVKRPTAESLIYLTGLKKKMQLLTTHIVELDMDDESAVVEKEYSELRRQRGKQKNGQRRQEAANSNGGKQRDGERQKTRGEGSNKSAVKNKSLEKSKNLLRRKRYHNFTPTVMAHEFLAFRRLDRFYHRATLRFDGEGHLSNGPGSTMRPFLVLSLSGDIFLNGQVPRLVGLFLAVVRGLVAEEVFDCVFDEKYPHLVPTPPVPVFAEYAAEAFYIKWEGKLSSILTPRKSKHYSKGWNDEATLQRVSNWQTTMRERVARQWLVDGVDAEGRLIAERNWTREVLEPWAMKARVQLEDYRCWKASQALNDRASVSEALLGASSNDAPTANFVRSLDSVDPTAPSLFQKALDCLRKVDASGQWPSTTSKRQLVMVSTLTEEQGDSTASAPSLSIAHTRAKSGRDTRTSAYDFAEGEGGASGSFSVGAMPGDQCSQPKANEMFPELMKVAFELEIALRPDREPSSTIAINRNAQFRPHTDSGAGAGQSTSLIVGLGTYAGGELVVEGEVVDIRYNAVEFNGWKQRHWTMPFAGERYSLVWFTPKGCEGVHGIDLCQS